MHRVTMTSKLPRLSISATASRVLLATVAVGGVVVGCTPAPVQVEVLPPRTSVSCSAPTASDPALGTGLLDVVTTLGAHGAYVADLRVSVKGADTRIDGFSISYTVPKGSSSDVEDTAEGIAGEIVVGDVILSGKDDDRRVAVVENVELIPRDLAIAFQEDDGLGLNKIEFATLGVHITPIVDGENVVAAESTFAVDLCAGCLVQPPDICSDDGEFALIPVTCRPGQDTPLFTCVQAGAN